MLKDLTYKVMVIDDEEVLYEQYIEFIEDKLSKEGYLLKHRRIESLDDLNDTELGEVDLFLVDLKFGSEDKGPEFIRKIRENHLTDILFYSSDKKAINGYRASGDFQGVFFAVRDENTTEIKDMIDQLTSKMIHRSNTPLSCRGIVLGSVAEFDNIIKEKVGLLMKLLETDKRVIDECTKMLLGSFRGTSNKLRDFTGIEFHKGIKQWGEVKNECIHYRIEDLIFNEKITDSKKNLRILMLIYKEVHGVDKLYEELNAFSILLDERNILAHVKEVLGDDGYYRFKHLNDDDELVLSAEKCREIRSSIVRCSEIIKSIT